MAFLLKVADVVMSEDDYYFSEFTLKSVTRYKTVFERKGWYAW